LLDAIAMAGIVAGVALAARAFRRDRHGWDLQTYLWPVLALALAGGQNWAGYAEAPPVASVVALLARGLMRDRADFDDWKAPDRPVRSHGL
jgi:hypothetical protein